MITGIIPCHNAESTLYDSISSLWSQSIPLTEVIVVDDGSSDNSVAIANNLNCRVICVKQSKGRGHARMVGVSESKTPFILFCDSSNIIDSDFAEKALSHFDSPNVSACFGRIKNHENLNSSLTAWCGFHLFKENKPYRIDSHKVHCLITYAVLLKKEHIIAVGNFNPALRQCEDQDMGEKLLKNQYELISDPSLITYSLRKESLKSLYLRYDRWYSDYGQMIGAYEKFFINFKSSILVLAREDLKNRNFKCLAISLILPFYIFLNDIFGIRKFVI